MKILSKLLDDEREAEKLDRKLIKDHTPNRTAELNSIRRTDIDSKKRDENVVASLKYWKKNLNSVKFAIGGHEQNFVGIRKYAITWNWRTIRLVRRNRTAPVERRD